MYVGLFMKKLWLLVYFSVVPVAIWGDCYDEIIFLKKIGGLEVLVNLLLLFYYLDYKKLKFIQIDWYLIEALLFTIAAGLLILEFKDIEILMLINTIGFYLTQFMFISVFRSEGSILPAVSVVFKEWKMIMMSILFIVGFVFVLIKFIPNSLLVISFVYSTQMMILFWMAYFRPVSFRVFVMGFLGIFFLIVANLWLTINLLFHQFFCALGVWAILYGCSQFLIVESVLVKRNKTIYFNQL